MEQTSLREGSEVVSRLLQLSSLAHIPFADPHMQPHGVHPCRRPPVTGEYASCRCPSAFCCPQLSALRAVHLLTLSLHHLEVGILFATTDCLKIRDENIGEFKHGGTSNGKDHSQSAGTQVP